MTEPVSLAEAKLFLRVSHDSEDTLIETFIAAAKAWLEEAVQMTLSEMAPPQLRLCLLYLVAHAYGNRGEMPVDLTAVDVWIRPFREVRL